MARYIDTKKNLMEIENPVKNVDIGKAVDTSKNLTSLKTTSFGVLSNKSLEQLNSLLAFTPVISFNEDTAMVTITCETVGSSIYYTLDGSTPSVSKTKYSAPFSVDKSCTIKAIGVKSGLNNSAVSTLEVEYKNPEEINMLKKQFTIKVKAGSMTSAKSYPLSLEEGSAIEIFNFIHANFDKIICANVKVDSPDTSNDLTYTNCEISQSKAIGQAYMITFTTSDTTKNDDSVRISEDMMYYMYFGKGDSFSASMYKFECGTAVELASGALDSFSSPFTFNFYYEE